MSPIRPAHALGLTLLVTALLAPATALQFDDGGDEPEMTFTRGADWDMATEAGFADRFDTRDDGSAFDLELSGLPGGTVTIDRLVEIDASEEIGGYRWLIEDPAGMDGVELDARLWTGEVAPDSDDDPAVCSLADLTRVGLSEGRCPAGTAHVQVVYSLPGDAEGSDVVQIRPEILISGQA